jgi:hypothetical protein
MLDKTAATETLERNESEEAQELENFDVAVEGHRGLLHRFAPQRLVSRIVLLNLLGLVILVTGILYFNQFRQGLIDARVQSLTTQAQIIAAAIRGPLSSIRIHWKTQPTPSHPMPTSSINLIFRSIPKPPAPC